MKITPLDIRQKTFEKNFRGYDKDEVNAFLIYLSQEWEKLMEEKKILQMKFEQSEKEATKLREVEESLFKTLKTAEDTGASIIEQANKTAELILKEAHMNADALSAESKNRAKDVIDQADSQARSIMEDLKEDVHDLIESYETLLAQREIILKNLKNIGNDTLENIRYSQEEFKNIDVSAHAKMVKELQRKSSYFTIAEKNKEIKQTIISEINEEEKLSVEKEKKDSAKSLEGKSQEPQPEGQKKVENEDADFDEHPTKEDLPKKKQSGSFFDQFD